jgi:hypothetical protein
MLLLLAVKVTQHLPQTRVLVRALKARTRHQVGRLIVGLLAVEQSLRFGGRALEQSLKVLVCAANYSEVVLEQTGRVLCGEHERNAEVFELGHLGGQGVALLCVNCLAGCEDVLGHSLRALSLQSRT